MTIGVFILLAGFFALFMVLLSQDRLYKQKEKYGDIIEQWKLLAMKYRAKVEELEKQMSGSEDSKRGER